MENTENDALLAEFRDWLENVFQNSGPEGWILALRRGFDGFMPTLRQSIFLLERIIKSRPSNIVLIMEESGWFRLTEPNSDVRSAPDEYFAFLEYLVSVYKELLSNVEHSEDQSLDITRFSHQFAIDLQSRWPHSL